MANVTVHLDPELERDLDRFMRLRGIGRRSEAALVALTEGLQSSLPTGRQTTDFRELIGAGLKAPCNPQPRFARDDDFWR